jgi:hypothetical protein
MTDWKKIGDVAHLMCLANAAAFAYSVVMHSSSAVFDPVWRPEGFCVSNRDVPFWNSHDLCLYVDTIGAIVSGIIYFFLKDSPGMAPANELVKFNILGIFAHGLGHAGISKAMRDGVVPESGLLDVLGNASSLDLLKQVGSFIFFWVFLLKATMPTSSFKIVVPMAIVSSIMGAIVPGQFGFTYTQTVLLFAFSLNQLMRPSEEKTVEYARYPLMVGVPLSFIAWIESTQCSKFVMGIGGHLIYDAYIPISVIFFYLVCWKDTKGKSKME